MNIRTSQNNFWDRFPLVSGLVIAASIFMYLGWLFDPNKGSDNSFYNLVAPDLYEIRNGHYLGLLTSSLLQKQIIFFVWGIGWIWYFGKTIEKHVNILFYICLIISSIIFPVLFEILIFEEAGSGLGGLIYALFGFTWVMSVYEPINWSVSNIEKLLAITFIFLCILVNYMGFYETGIAGLVGGFIWGVFVGFVLGSIKNKILQISIPTFVLGVFFIPIFWAPWQVSWLLNKAEKYEKQNKFEEAKGFYSKVLKKDSINKDEKEWLVHILNDEAQKYLELKEFEKSKTLCIQILEIDPQNEIAKKNIQINELFEEFFKYYNEGEFDKAKKPLSQILEIIPDDENIKKDIQINELSKDFWKYLKQQDFDKAKNALSQIIEINSTEDAKKLLKTVELAEDFFNYYNKKDFDKAKNSLLQILELDPNNQWAKENLKIVQNKTR